jgi:hypothetical protein
MRISSELVFRGAHAPSRATVSPARTFGAAPKRTWHSVAVPGCLERKVCDDEGVIASTRGACAPQIRKRKYAAKSASRKTEWPGRNRPGYSKQIRPLGYTERRRSAAISNAPRPPPNRAHVAGSGTDCPITPMEKLVVVKMPSGNK